MPDSMLEVHVLSFIFILFIILNLRQWLETGRHNNNDQWTIGNKPTTWPPPMPLPFLILEGRFAMLAMMGYLLHVPNDDKFVWSA